MDPGERVRCCTVVAPFGDNDEGVDEDVVVALFGLRELFGSGFRVKLRLFRSIERFDFSSKKHCRLLCEHVLKANC